MTDRIDNLTPTPSIKKRQRLIALGMAGLVGCPVGLILWHWNPSTPLHHAPQAQPVTLKLADSTASVSPADVIIARTDKALREQKEKSDALQNQLQQLAQSEHLREDDKKAYTLQIDQLQQQLAQLENQVKATARNNVPSGGMALDGSPLPVLPLPKGMKNITIMPPQFTSTSVIQSDELKLMPLTDATHVTDDQEAFQHDPAYYVPAGTFAEAILLSGLDAGAGVTAQAQPRPVLLRLTSDGHLPQQQDTPLKDCVVLAAAYGDISSERAYLRLERMSCLQKNHITDFPVYGYVTGSDGKVGVRGRPVWREGALVKRSFFAGLLAGIGQGISNLMTPATSLTTMHTTANDVAKQGIAQGGSSSLAKLADYQIQRAEQYQPVIQVNAGTPVDVIFHTGFYWDGRALAANPTPNLTQPLDDVSSPTTTSSATFTETTLPSDITAQESDTHAP